MPQQNFSSNGPGTRSVHYYTIMVFERERENGFLSCVLHKFVNHCSNDQAKSVDFVDLTNDNATRIELPQLVGVM
jgi:hypothetical protein